ncbi:MAG: type IX secretion system protein PorQ [Flavobacteriia bacterium]|nr:type IX secretion system protein PorQ [Flavobacteriia bacterium]
MRLFWLVFFLYLSSFIFSQSGGESSYQVLNVPFSARTASLGTDFISVLDKDVQLSISNPCLLNSSMHKKLAFSQGVYGATQLGSLVYAKSIDSSRTFSLNLRNINYGNLRRFDTKGNEIGTFYSGDFVLGSGFAKKINPVMGIGVQANLIYSQLESYASFAGGIDFSSYYQFLKHKTFITIIAKNIGGVIKPYIKNQKLHFPLEVQMAISHQLKHAPFRISILAHNLNRWDLTYFDPNKSREIDPLTGDTLNVPKAKFSEKLFRHFTYQAELLLSKNIHFRLAFDYHRRKELKVNEKPGIAGFSFGVGLMFKRIQLDYGFVCYSASGYGNFLTLSTNLNHWKRNE